MMEQIEIDEWKWDKKLLILFMCCYVQHRILRNQIRTFVVEYRSVYARLFILDLEITSSDMQKKIEIDI